MLDINYIRENLEKVKRDIKARKMEVDLEKLLELDADRKKLIQQVDELRAKRNIAAKNRDVEKGKKIKAELDGLEKSLSKLEKDYYSLILQVPNINLFLTCLDFFLNHLTQP